MFSRYNIYNVYCLHYVGVFFYKHKKIEGVSKLIHPLFSPPLPCLPHNSLFTAAMLLISYKMIYWALNSLYKLV